ncbi:hypothetical protein N9164_04140 [Draconibacterium sp.]|nr:hypothetical protein [Draconibacterium sp.]
MKRFLIVIFMIFFLSNPSFVFGQNQQAEIDSLVRMMRTAGREWNDYANPLIKIGEPAVKGLIKNAEDKNLPQWNRRISVMTLNNIRSLQWKGPALKMLFDKNEDPILRNHATAGLRGYDLSEVKSELWKIYNEAENQFHKSNLASLLLTADTALAYKAFHELYATQDGHIQRYALQNLIQLRPKESTSLLLNALQGEDWMTGNLAMDSLITSEHFIADDLFSVYKKSETNEEVQWRIVYVFGHRKKPESLTFLLEALQNESWLVHTEAAVGLCRFDKGQVIERTKKLVNDDRSYVSDNSRWIIHQLQKEY